MTANDTQGNLVLRDRHFLKIRDGQLFLWDYEQHAQFEVSTEHLARLLELSTGDALDPGSSVDRDIDSAGVLVRSNERETWQWDWLGHIFHYGTCFPMARVEESEQAARDYALKYWEYSESLDATEPPVEVIKGGRRIALPQPDATPLREMSLLQALTSRRTCRDFDGGAVPVGVFSTLLSIAFGAQSAPDPTMPENIRPYGYRRTSPSAGGLQSTEPYVWVNNVDGIPPGVYHYLSCRHELEVVREALPEYQLATYLNRQYWANDLSFAVILTSRFDKLWWKYPHSRAYRAMLMDVGHLSQTLNLAITACALHPWVTECFHDRELAQVLQCEPGLEHPMFVVGCGTGSGSSVDRHTRSLAEAQRR